MRPIRLLLDGFGCYREPAEADFSDVDFFALTGPTGSGKSTVIDGLCFALYGTVPRWGKENVIAQALAPAANACKVALVFEASGQRYGVVRELTRSPRGQVGTREARIERLDPTVPASAPLADLLAASVEKLAEGPDQVKARVQDVLGLTYEHFTQSVLLPQGRFAEFLHAKAADRQDLLVQLLAFGVYTAIGQRARERARLASERGRIAQSAREELTDATAEVEEIAAARVMALDEVGKAVTARLASLDLLRAQAERAAQQVSDARRETAMLAAVHAPAEVADLAGRIANAAQNLAERKARAESADRAEMATQQSRSGLGDKSALQLARAAYGQRRDLKARLAAQQQALTVAQERERSAQTELDAAEAMFNNSRDELAHAERSQAAVALAHDLLVGDDCPVCLRPLSELPSHPAAASLAEAKAAVGKANGRLAEARAAIQNAAKTAAAAGNGVEVASADLASLVASLDAAPAEADVDSSLAQIDVADQALAQAQHAARAARGQVLAAENERASLADEEKRAWTVLGQVRDSVLALGAPGLAGEDLAADWAMLSAWTQQQYTERAKRLLELDAAAADVRRHVTEAVAMLAALLAEHGIEGVTDLTRAEAALAAARAHAANRLAAVRDNRAKAARLDEQIGTHKEAEQVASMLGNLLRATAFERWLCGEALDSLVAEASGVLLELSGGQYKLGRDQRNELIVIDYADAGATRPVHTLSGGETFQASLALALALSRQVTELSAGQREMNSMFLDEGFGTLDPVTLEVVGSTLERLAADSDRMIGIVTHVSDLAARAGTRFVVSRSGATSTLRKESS